MRYLGFIRKKVIPVSYCLDSFYLAQFLAQEIDGIANTHTHLHANHIPFFLFSFPDDFSTNKQANNNKTFLSM